MEARFFEYGDTVRYLFQPLVVLGGVPGTNTIILGREDTLAEVRCEASDLILIQKNPYRGNTGNA
jgi:hypothetical protein